MKINSIVCSCIQCIWPIINVQDWSPQSVWTIGRYYPLSRDSSALEYLCQILAIVSAVKPLHCASSEAQCNGLPYSFLSSPLETSVPAVFLYVALSLSAHVLWIDYIFLCLHVFRRWSAIVDLWILLQLTFGKPECTHFIFFAFILQDNHRTHC